MKQKFFYKNFRRFKIFREDFELSSFQLDAVGAYINPDVPIIDTIWVKVAVV